MMMASRLAPSPVPPDTNDIDQYLNYDQLTIPSPTFSPISSGSKSLSAPTSIPSNNALRVQPSNQPAFAPPSHQYEAYPNLNGLPSGAIHEAYSVNQAQQTSFALNQGYFGGSMNAGFGMNTGDDFDFGSGYGTYNNTDMDFDFNTASSLLTQPVDGLDATFIDPSAIADPESPQVQQPPKRAYPGMHQQAALAKAQAEQKQKEADAQRQNQAAPSTSRPSSNRPAGSISRPPTDAIVEDKISQLLNQMRHQSVGSSNEEDAATPTVSGSNNHGSRSKKDEEDMDEDERLLASEEGKKLSSKERRQLRNKVSARAFRSRRKEYIGQLEGEIAAKSAEADELRNKNQALMEENRQLNNLTKALLSSDAFKTYLKDMSDQSTPAVATSLRTPTVKAEPAIKPTQKDVNVNAGAAQEAQSQNAQYVGMTMIPEHPVEPSSYENSNDPWANMDFSLYEAQVYAVTSIPQGPSIDELRPNVISNKASDLPLPDLGHSKIEPPMFARLPCIEDAVKPAAQPNNVVEEGEVDDSDPTPALFRDCSAPTNTGPFRNDEPIFGNILLEKAFGRIELVVGEGLTTSRDQRSTSVERFNRLCSNLEALSERISMVIP